MRTIVCGGRHYADREYLYIMLDTIHRAEPITHLIAGGQTGADMLAVKWAKTRSVPFTEFPVSDDEWNTFGRAAGPMRNHRMIVEGKPSRLIAFPGDKGTADMTRKAKAALLTVVVVPPTPPPQTETARTPGA